MVGLAFFKPSETLSLVGEGRSLVRPLTWASLLGSGTRSCGEKGAAGRPCAEGGAARGRSWEAAEGRGKVGAKLVLAEGGLLVGRAEPFVTGGCLSEVGGAEEACGWAVQWGRKRGCGFGPGLLELLEDENQRCLTLRRRVSSSPGFLGEQDTTSKRCWMKCGQDSGYALPLDKKPSEISWLAGPFFFPF